MTRIDVNALPAAPWKNGGGATRTIAVSPPEANFDNFDWRISIAEVASSGDFSRFPGVERTILLLDGAGMTLHFDDGRVVSLTEAFEPYVFRGDDAVRCHLLNGTTWDFNVMTRRGRAQAEVKRWQSEFREQITADAGVLFCPRGDCRIDDVELHSGWALRMDRLDSKIRFVPQTPDALIVAVLISGVQH